MTTGAPTTCSCCGENITETDQIDVRFTLPDAALTVPETARHWANGELLRVEDDEWFARCLLPVRLSGELLLVLGTWIRISGADFARARTLWDEPEYAGLVLTGTLANGIGPWGEDLLGAPVTAVVRDVDEIPSVDSSDDELLSHVLHTVWNRDHVLRCFEHPLPVPVQTALDERWSIERTAGLAARVVEGVWQFAGPGRTAHAKISIHAEDGTPAELLATLTHGAPHVDAGHQVTEEHAGGLRHAFWLTSSEEGGTRHELYGYVIQDGQALRLACLYEEPGDLRWAQHVWRSVRYRQ
ncbi:DUF2199 domain-containing protein [Microbispora sp. H13382]|uniref:DUF2199 domain-containing protein n=1 Tax=Microbispora sp. H13382 TaxID=2729112 RepID=UPI0016022041|nr:DUF2199 domain-containing protein [Microbispora sp. H13382]